MRRMGSLSYICFFQLIISYQSFQVEAQEAKDLNEKQGILAVYWCGFSKEYCGESHSDDVTTKATHVIMAFAKINQDGSVAFDHSSNQTFLPLITKWQSRGQKVLISIGGHKCNWAHGFTTDQSMTVLAQSISNLIKFYNLDGVDLQIHQYDTQPIKIAGLINLVRVILDSKFPYQQKLLILSPECMGVYQAKTSQIKDEKLNYWVPILQRVMGQIDYISPQSYGMIYPDQIAGTQDFIVNVYLNWLNVQSLVGEPINNFIGVPQSKLILCLPAAPQAGGQKYYIRPDILKKAADEIYKRQGKKIGGIMLWSSHWDAHNYNVMSNKANIII